MLLIAHGDRGGEGDNRAVWEHAARLRRIAPDREVRVGLLNGSPSLEEALAETSGLDCVHAVPLMMSEGYFTETAIPTRLGACFAGNRQISITMHPAIGVNQTVSDLVVQVACAGATRLALELRRVSVLLIGHGAKTNDRARQAIEQHAVVVRAKGLFEQVETAYLEEPPFLDDAAGRLRRPTVAVGMFVSDGLHAGEDVPGLLKQFSNVPIHYTGAICTHPAISEIIAQQLIAPDAERLVKTQKAEMFTF